MKARSTIPGSRYLQALALSVSCFALAACGGGGGSGSEAGTSSNSSNSNTPATQAEISSDKTSIDFGKVVIGQTAVRTVTITNTGDRSLVNFSVSDPGAPFAASGQCPETFVNQACEITVEFSPTGQQDYTSSFVIDGNAPEVTVNLAGTGQGLNVEISNLATSCVDPAVAARVVVTDANGDPITVLNADQFFPELNGAPIDPFVFTGILDAEPLSVALTVDWSNSLNFFRPTLRDTSEAFIDTLADEDTAAFYRFAREIDLNAQDFVVADAAGKDALKDSLFSVFDGDTTVSSVWESANFAVDQAAPEPNPNRTVFLLTDGLDTSTAGVTVQDVIDNAVAKQVNVFTLGYGDVIDADPLEALAQGTGGLYFAAPDAQGLGDIYQSIVSILTNQYEIRFDNPDLQAASQFTVRVVDDAGLEGEDTTTIAACP